MSKIVTMAEAEIETSQVALKNMAITLIEASLDSKVSVDVTYDHKANDEDDDSVGICFSSENETLFFTTLYTFYSVEKNMKIMTMALSLMKDATKYKEIRKKVRAE